MLFDTVYQLRNTVTILTFLEEKQYVTISLPQLQISLQLQDIKAFSLLSSHSFVSWEQQLMEQETDLLILMTLK